jgi:hypothetical protein
MSTEPNQDLNQFCNSIFNSFKEAFEKNEVKDLQKGLLSFHVYKATSLMKAIKSLSECENVSEGYILLRTLVNLCINILWINAEDVENRAQRYAAFDVVYKQRGIERLLKQSKNVDVELLTKKLSENKKKIEILKKKYGLDKNYNMSSWSGKSIAGMAKECEMEWYYDIVYSYLSNHEHSNPNSVQEYFKGFENGKIVLKEIEEDDGGPQLVVRAMDIYLKLVVLYNEKFETDIIYSENEWTEIENRVLKDDGAAV